MLSFPQHIPIETLRFNRHSNWPKRNTVKFWETQEFMPYYEKKESVQLKGLDKHKSFLVL